MVRRRPPKIVHQFHPPELLENDAPPIGRGTHRRQAALALAAILITEDATLAQAIATQSMRAKQPRAIFVDGADRLFARYRRPNQPVHVLYRLDFRFDDAHLTFTIAPAPSSLGSSAVYNTVVLGRIVEMAQPSLEDTVLDVACGPGLLACAFARAARRVSGIDLTPKMLEQAKELQQKQGLENLSWQEGDVQALPYRDATFPSSLPDLRFIISSIRSRC